MCHPMQTRVTNLITPAGIIAEVEVPEELTKADVAAIREDFHRGRVHDRRGVAERRNRSVGRRGTFRRFAVLKRMQGLVVAEIASESGMTVLERPRRRPARLSLGRPRSDPLERGRAYDCGRCSSQ